MKIAFMGSPDFALPALQNLIDSKHQITHVYTKPPKPSGRGNKILPTPVEVLAKQHNLPLYTPKNLKNEPALINADIDLIIVVAYGVILPESILQIPKFGCINIHPSILPRWRGAAPIERAMLAGDRETGVSIMMVSERLDAGDILRIEKTPILKSDNRTSLYNKLSALGAEMLIPTMEDWVEGKITPVVQDESQVCYANKISNEDQRINWNYSSRFILQQINAFSTKPGAFFTNKDDVVIKILRAQAQEATKHRYSPGTIINEQAHIACAEGGIIMPFLVQRAGKNAMSIDEFLRGNSLTVGEIVN